MNSDITLTEREEMEKQGLLYVELGNEASCASANDDENVSGLVYDYQNLLQRKQAEIHRLQEILQRQYKEQHNVLTTVYTCKRALTHLASHTRTSKLQKEMINYVLNL